MSPLIRLTSCREIARPSPVPAYFVEFPRSRRQNRPRFKVEGVGDGSALQGQECRQEPCEYLGARSAGPKRAVPPRRPGATPPSRPAPLLRDTGQWPDSDDRTREANAPCSDLLRTPRGPGTPSACSRAGQWPSADGLAHRPGSVRRTASRRHGWRPSISGCRCRHPPATYPRARTDRPQALAVRSCSRWGLPSRDGPPPRWWSLAPPFHPYRRSEEPRRSVFCGTFPRVTPGGRYPPPCPVEPGPSSTPRGFPLGDAVARPAHPLAKDRARQAAADLPMICGAECPVSGLVIWSDDSFLRL
ncbi:MAG: hypothetical protein JWQ67_2213 [Marmoricola sp.]|nr:hypothetical protein [Marmoricola sp.]